MMFSWLLKRVCCRAQQSKKYYAVVFFASLTCLPVIKPFTSSSVGIITNRHYTFTSSSSSVSTNNSWLETTTYSHFPIVTSARSRRYSATTDTDTNTDEKKEEKEIENRKNTITIISRDVKNNNFLVALKPPSVFCHPSEIYTGKQNKEKFQQVEIPMLQRVCDFHSNYLQSSSPEGEKEGDSTTCSKDFCCSLELMHSLDRGASGALLFTYNNENNNNNENKSELITKTYVALVRGEGINKGENYLEKGWFDISREIKQNGISYDTTTSIKFIASTSDDSDEEREETTEEILSKETSTSPPRLSLVLVKTRGEERLHQIRRVLRQISHPIIGDSKHGDSKTNREWKEKRNLSSERLCLHLSKIEFPSFSSEEGEGEDSYHTVSCSCPLYKDLMELLKVNAPNVWKKALTVLQQEEEMQEGVVLFDENDENNKYEIGEYNGISTPPPSSSISTSSDDGVDKMEQPIEILQQGKHYLVANKPSGVVVHNSSFNSDSTTDTTTPSLFSTPMLQRIRNQTNRKVNLIHRLDRGTSGCLLFSFASNTKSKEGEEKGGGKKNKSSCKITKRLNESMQDKTKAIKTYIAFCDGDGAEYLTRGWFTHDQPVKNEWGKLIEDCTTDFCFIKSITLSPLPSPSSSNIVDDDDDDNSDKDNIHNSNRLMEGRKISVVLARPKTGRWHQIRQHLRQLNYHTILNDSSHGKSRTNRNFREYSNVNRLCLHLARIQIPFNDKDDDDDDTKEGEGGGMIDVTSPIPTDMLQLFEGELGEDNSNSINYDDRMRLKEFWEEVKPILVSEGVSVG